MKNYTNLFFYPVGSGGINGAFVLANGNSIVSHKHSKSIVLNKPSAMGRFVAALKNWFFVRGLILFFYYIFKVFEGVDKSYTNYNEYLLRQPIKTKTKFRNKLKLFYVVFVLLTLAFFVGLPLATKILLDMAINNVFINSLFNVVLKIVFLLTFFTILRWLPITKNIYQYNSAINKVANSFEDDSINYSKIAKAKNTRVLNIYNFFIVGLIGLYIFVPIFSFDVAAIINVLIKIAVASFWLGICYEVLYLLQYRYDKCKVARFVSSPIVAISYITSLPYTNEHFDIVINTVEELSLMTKREFICSNQEKSFRQFYIDVKTELAQNGITDKGEADYIICEALGINKTKMLMLDTITTSQQNKVNKIVKKRIQHIPLNKIVKKQNFYGIDFYINEHVLAPRQDTEILVEKAIQKISQYPTQPKVLDMCTGSGIIAVTIAKNTNAKVTAVDISNKALLVANKNAKNNNVNINFIKSDTFKDLKVSNKFDIIISNPPYIPTLDIDKLDQEVRDHDPKIALDGGIDGLKFYRLLADNAPKYLKSGGVIMLEIGYDQKHKVSNILQNNFKDIQVFDDYGGNPRVIIATKKG